MNHIESNDYVVIGKIGSTYGVQGWLKVTSFTESIETILQYDSWYLKSHDGWELFRVEDGKKHGKGVIAKLTGPRTPEEARQLTGKEIAIHRSQLPPTKNNEYYWTDLIGFEVFNTDNVKLGTLIYLMETGANDVFVIQDQRQREHAIPWILDSVVKQVLLNDKKIIVDWELI